jgi:hypothetical protein
VKKSEWGIMQNWLEEDPSRQRVAARLICVADFLSVAGITRSFVEMGPKMASEQDQLHE